MSTSSPPPLASPDLSGSNLFQLLIESATNHAVFLLDPVGRVTTWNSGAERILGYSAEEMVGRSLVQIYPSEEAVTGAPQRRLDQARTEGHQEDEGQRLRKDGTLFWAQQTTYPLFNGDGQHLGFGVLLRDVTAKRRQEQERQIRLEQALQNSEARYRTLFEHSQVGIVLANSESTYLDANPSACRMLGYPLNELVGLHASDIVVPSEAEQIAPALAAINQRTNHHREWQFRRKNGTVFSADVVATQMPDGTLLGLIRDLTDRKRADDYRELLVSVVESSQDAIFGTDAEGTITSWNGGAEATFGYRAGEVIGISLSQLFPETGEEELKTLLTLIRQGVGVQQLETVRRTRDGRLIDVSVTASPIRNSQGQVIGSSRVVRDVTDVKNRERELARMTRLYDALSQVNQAIVWSADREELFQRVCRALVERGGFRMAWVGLHDPTTQRLLPVVSFGDADHYLESIRVYGDDRPEGRGPTGQAFRTGQSYICNRIWSNLDTLPWRSEMERRGFRASASFPIRDRGRICGTLTVYADSEDFFHEREIGLLEEAAGDVSFALENFAREESRRQMDETLRSEKQFSEVMLESMPGVIYFYDRQGRFLRWNQSFQRVSGYSTEEVARMHPLDFFLGEDRKRVEERITEVFISGESSVEAGFVKKDGTSIPFFFTGRRVEYNGQLCLVGVGIDISDRKAAEQRLAESERNYRELVQHANSIILRWNSEGLITFMNDYGLHFFGYTAEAIYGRHVLGTIVPSNDSSGRDLHELMEEICSSPEAFEQNINENIRRNGERVWIAWTNRIVRDEQGKVMEILSIGSDITDRVRMEAEREKRHRAETADRIKSAFLATMSHELRTPLNPIIGFTGIILQGLAGPLNAEQTKQLEMVRGSARHLLALVNDVLDISKIEAGQLEVARASFDLVRSISRVVGIVQPQVQARGLRLRVEVDPRLDQAVNDQRRFEQILLNLLSNAIKFTDQGGIELVADLVPDDRVPGVDSSGPFIRVQVSDTGIGIKAEDLPNLFQPFRQVDSGLARKHEGTGLGLAICRRLTMLMGGEIHAESEWGKGSRFQVILPLQGPVKS